MLDRVGLGPLGGRHPRDLSGRQQRRVTLPRRLVTSVLGLAAAKPWVGFHRMV